MKPITSPVLTCALRTGVASYAGSVYQVKSYASSVELIKLSSNDNHLKEVSTNKEFSHQFVTNATMRCLSTKKKLSGLLQEVASKRRYVISPTRGM